MLSILGMLALLTSPASAERLWTEGNLGTGITRDTPITYGAFSKLAKKAAPAVVSIETEVVRPVGMFSRPGFGPQLRGRGLPQLHTGAGSGFIIHPDGYILSNNHVVEGARTIKVHLKDGQVFSAKLVGRDPATDLSLLKIEAKEPLPIVPLGDSDSVEIGDWVVAIGNPMGLSHTVTQGIVSAKGRREIKPDERLQYRNFIQTDASINPGNSGGPLFNLRGEVIGINTAINAYAQNIGFSVPINMVKTVLPRMRSTGHVDRSWIGVGIKPVTKKLAASFGMSDPQGALIGTVARGGPADKAGLRPGDVITHFNHQKIKRFDDLPWLASNAGIGKVAQIDVWREGRPETFKVTLGQLPGSGQMDQRQHVQGDGDQPSTLGLTLESIDKEQARRFKIKSGVIVRKVDLGSPAADAGVQPGDIITRFNGRDVTSAKALRRGLKGVKPGALIRLLVQRKAGRAFIAFTR